MKWRAETTWLTTADVAVLWGTCVETVTRSIRKGNLRATKLPGGREWRVSYQDAVDALTPPEGIPVVPVPRASGESVQEE